MRDKSTGETPDGAISRLATLQYGVVSAAQLVASGVDRRAVWRRIQGGRLHRIHRGVYAVGHARLPKEGHWLAAVLACGKDALLSHRSAAALWELLPVPAGPIDVTVGARSGRRSRSGIAVHRSATVEPVHRTCHRNIPVTSPARTVADLRRILPGDMLGSVLRRAEVMRLDVGHQPDHQPDRSRSELERLFLRLCRAHDLPLPETNVLVGPFEVDFLWRDRRLIVEVDGFRHHGGRSAFERDRARDARLAVMGYRVLRFTHRQLTREPECVAPILRALVFPPGRQTRA